MSKSACFIALLGALFVSCSHTESDKSNSTTSDTSTESSTDTESDTDTNSDTSTESSTDTNSDTDTETSNLIGPEGGEVNGPEGVKLSIPAEALEEEVEILISIVSQDFPIGVHPDSAMFMFEPAGLSFSTPITVSFPSIEPLASVFWTDLNTTSFHQLSSSWAQDRVSVQIDHFSLAFVGWNRRSGHCETVVAHNECTITTEGAPHTDCDVVPPEGPVIPGYCFNQYDGAGNVIGAVCQESGCQASEEPWQCGNQLDDDCDGLPDSLDTECTECLSNIDCGAGAICEGGFCQLCSTQPVECSMAHGTPDSACSYMIDESGTTANGLCMHRQDVNNASCGTFCLQDTLCATDEVCGNHVDDNCDGVVDDSCPTQCSSDAGCSAGEICDNGYCKSCPGADLPAECSTNSQHSIPDSSCMYYDANENLVSGGVCLHITDAAGTVCGTTCTESPTCPSDEICGNHIDDNCDGTVDEFCQSCNSNGDCQSGEICQY